MASAVNGEWSPSGKRAAPASFKSRQMGDPIDGGCHRPTELRWRPVRKTRLACCTTRTRQAGVGFARPSLYGSEKGATLRQRKGQVWQGRHMAKGRPDSRHQGASAQIVSESGRPSRGTASTNPMCRPVRGPELCTAQQLFGCMYSAGGPGS